MVKDWDCADLVREPVVVVAVVAVVARSNRGVKAALVEDPSPIAIGFNLLADEDIPN